MNNLVIPLFNLLHLCAQTNANGHRYLIFSRKLDFLAILYEIQRAGRPFCPSQTSMYRNQASGKRRSVGGKAILSRFQAGTFFSPKSFAWLVVLANLSKQLLIAVTKQTEGQMVVDAED